MSGANLERETVRMCPGAPSPFVGAWCNFEAAEGRTVIGGAIGQSSAGDIPVWHEKNAATARDANLVTAAAVGKRSGPAPEIQGSSKVGVEVGGRNVCGSREYDPKERLQPGIKA